MSNLRVVKPRKATRQPLPPRERAICERVRQVRESVGLTQEAFAQQLGTTRERVAMYEKFRTALRYDFALRVCATFIVSERWLATGEGRMRQYLGLRPEDVGTKVKMDALYSEAFEQALAVNYAARLHRHPQSASIQLRSEDEMAAAMPGVFRYMLKIWTNSLPARHVPRFLFHLLECGRQGVLAVTRAGKLPGRVGTHSFDDGQRMLVLDLALPGEEAPPDKSRPDRRLNPEQD